MTRACASNLVFGGAPLGNLYNSVSSHVADAALDIAWHAGVRAVDTAPYYGHGLSETRLGCHLARRPEHDFTISTKVGRCLVACDPTDVPDHGFAQPLAFRPVFDYSGDGIRTSFRDSVRRLGVTAVDALLLHDIGALTHGDRAPAVLDQALGEALPAMRAIQTEGGAHRIGLGVNEWQVCEAVLDATDLDQILLAGRYNLLDQSALDFLGRAHARGVEVHIAGVFASGLLAGGDTVDYARSAPCVEAKRDRLAMLAARYDVPLAAVAVQFALAHPTVARLVIGWRSPAEVADAVRWLGISIPATLWTLLKDEGLLDPRAPTPC